MCLESVGSAMKKSFGFRSKNGVSPFGSSINPVRDSGHGINFQPGYRIRDKVLRKIHEAAIVGNVAKVQHVLLFGKNGLNDGKDEQVSGVEGPGRDPSCEFPFQGSWIPSWDPAPHRLYRQQKSLVGFGPTYNSPYRALLIVLKSFN